MAEIDVDSVQGSAAKEEAPTPVTSAQEPSDDDLDEVLKLMGVSVHYLESVFLEEVEASGLDRTATISQLEGLEILDPLAPPAEETKEEISVDDDDDDVVDRPGTPKRDNTHPKGGGPVILGKGANVLCPIDGKKGAAYVHCLLNDKSATPVVGFASVFMIYSNQYTIGDVLDTLGDYCATNGKDPKETFVWMYCLSANLHRVKQIPIVENMSYTSLSVQEIETQYDRIKRQILNIGHVMIMLNPWRDPILLKRCWCTLELYAAQQVIKEQIKDQGESTIDITVVFPPSVKMDLEITMLLGEEHPEYYHKNGILDLFYKMIGSIKVQNAVSTLHQDRNAIMKFVEENALGRPQYNLQCNQVLRRWFRAFKQEMQHLPQQYIPQKYPLKPLTLVTVDALAQQYAHYFGQLAILFENNDELEAAEEMIHRGQAIRATLSPESAEAAIRVPVKPLTYYNAASRLAANGDLDGAILALGKTMAIMEAAYGNQHIATGTVYYRIGDMLLAKSATDKSQKQGAMIAYKRALDVQEARLGKYHPVTCANYIQLGLYLETRGKFDDALEYYTKGQSLLGQNVPLAVKPFLTLEKKFLLRNQEDEAELAREKGDAIRNAIGIVDEPEPEESDSEDGSGRKERGEEEEDDDEDKQGEEAKEGAPAAPMQDLEDDEEGVEPAAAPKAEVEDLLAEYRATIAAVDSDEDSNAVDC